MLSILRKHFRQLYAEFLSTYADTPEGQAHRRARATAREAATANWQRVLSFRARGVDYTDAALLGLLPYAATSPEVLNGAWVHWSPVITGSTIDWFQSIGWGPAEKWPHPAHALVNLLQATEESDGAFAAAYSVFTTSPLSRGMQSNLISPILNALWPERYALCDAKSVLAVTRFEGIKVSTQIADYPASNAILQHVAADLAGELNAETLGLSPSDVLDMFSHWLYAIKGFRQAPCYLKVAPGEDAGDWGNCLARGDIGMGFYQLGDITGLDKEGFDARVSQVQTDHPEFTNAAARTVWSFVNATIGDYIVANRGTHEMLGVGVLSGPYLHVSGERYPRRRKVDWLDTTPRSVSEGGWRSTIIKLSRAKFEEIAAETVFPATTLARTPLGYFSEHTFELLRLLDEDPRYAVYQEHEAEFQQHLIEPFKQMLVDLALELPPEWLGRLETQKRLTSNILKNDYGHGGAWPFYWGAFYTKEGKRTSSAQLYMSLSSDVLNAGFSIGSRDSQQPTGLFWSNLDSLTPDLKDGLRRWLEGEPAISYPGATGIADDFEDWLAQGASPNLSVDLPANQVLPMSRQKLRTRIMTIMRRVWPLFLLATLDDPSEVLREYLGMPQAPASRNAQLSLADLAAQLSLPIATIQEWLHGLNRKGQGILYGPPGTGKTYAAHALAKHLISGGYGRTEIVQFHPAYAYEDFIEGIRPEGRGGQLAYRVRPGLLRTFCDEARQRPDSTFVLIIDEINRANLSRVFGELMYLLEYRGETIRLAVSGEAFSIPPNVRVIGTMNTADRSIALVDHALRRRFAFIRLAPEWGIVERFFANHDLAGISLSALKAELDRLNQEIEPDYRIGITFFLNDSLGQHLASIWRMEIEPYLDEYFFDQPTKVESFRWESVQKKLLAGSHNAD